MLACNYPEAVIESPVRERIVRYKHPLPLHPGTAPGCPDMLHREKPANEACFHEWVRTTYRSIFGCEKQPDGLMITIDAPIVKGLTIYGIKCGKTKFYGAWVEWSGTFIGWMRIQPHIAGIESDYAVGEVLGRPVFVGITLDLSGHDAIDKFTQGLNETAWDLGIA
jgi:hypothetical protein